MKAAARIAAAVALTFSIAAHAAAEWNWTGILSENFNADPSANWSYSGRQNGSSQNLIRWNGAGYVNAEWDESNYYSWVGDPQTIEPSRYSRPLGTTLTDQQTFKIGVTLRIGSVANTSEYYQVANFGLYNLAQMGPDRAMSDNWSGNTNLVKDASDFVEWNYFIQQDDWYNYYANTCPTMGAHITGVDGDYITGSGSDGYWHNTDMGPGNYLPTATNLYVEVTYFGAATDGNRRRAYGAVYTDEARTTILTVNGVGQYYWTVPMPDDKTFTLTEAAFFNYVGANYGGVNGTGSGTFDDLYVATGQLLVPGDANRDNLVDSQDFSILKAHFGEAGGWDNGDFNGDNLVDSQDFSILKANFGKSSPPGAPAPEPSALGLLALGAMGLLHKRRRVACGN
jgi:hypothetical protein